MSVKERAVLDYYEPELPRDPRIKVLPIRPRRFTRRSAPVKPTKDYPLMVPRCDIGIAEPGEIVRPRRRWVWRKGPLPHDNPLTLPRYSILESNFPFSKN